MIESKVIILGSELTHLALFAMTLVLS